MGEKFDKVLDRLAFRRALAKEIGLGTKGRGGGRKRKKV